MVRAPMWAMALGFIALGCSSARSAASDAYTKPADAELRQRLSPLEYEVTQHAETEPAFRNRFWDNHEPGLYVDVAVSYTHLTLPTILRV